jgi:hypothetical protein
VHGQSQPRARFVWLSLANHLTATPSPQAVRQTAAVMGKANSILGSQPVSLGPIPDLASPTDGQPALLKAARPIYLLALIQCCLGECPERALTLRELQAEVFT